MTSVRQLRREIDRQRRRLDSAQREAAACRRRLGRQLREAMGSPAGLAGSFALGVWTGRPPVRRSGESAWRRLGRVAAISLYLVQRLPAADSAAPAGDGTGAARGDTNATAGPATAPPA